MSAGGGGDRPRAAGMAGRHPGPGTRDELAPGVLMRALVVGVEDEGAAAGDRAGLTPSAARARLAGAVVIAGTALLAGVLGPGAGAGRYSAESGSNVPAAAGVAGSVESQGDSLVKTRKFGSDVVLGAAAAAAVSMSALAGDAVQWRVEDGGNGHWYAAIHPTPMPANFADQDSVAHAMGAHMATLQSSGENNFAIGLLSGAAGESNGAYFGLRRVGNSSTWQWIDALSLTWNSWGSNNCSSGPYPNNGGVGGEMVAHLYNRECGWIWDDTPPGWFVDQPTLTLIVEWDADCNTDGVVDYGQIINGALADANTNGVPDICECATHPELGACRCAGDIVTDGTVNGADLGTLLAYWGPANSGAFSQASDINHDGQIDGSDLGVLLSNWGTCQYPGVTVPAWATLIDAMPDPAVVTDPALRTAIAATGLAWRVRDTWTGIEMLLVPPGTFQMGCSASQQYPCSSAENPPHPVTLTQAFYLGRFETTQQQWQAKMGSNPSEYQGYQDSPAHPVEHLNWTQVQSFMSATGMRLPTESEWEYACRGGTTSAFPNGTNDDNSVENLAWYSANSENRPHPVGRKAPNGLGLHDMLGNVWEWVNDWYGPYPADQQTNPQGPSSGPYREIRGGAWIYATDFVRTSYRGYVTIDNPGFGVGFRAARNP